MISCLGAPTRHLFMPRDPFQLSSVVTSQYSKNIFLEKVSGKSPESCPKSLKSLLEKVSEKSLESFPGFFDPVSFELKYLYQVR